MTVEFDKVWVGSWILVSSLHQDSCWTENPELILGVIGKKVGTSVIEVKGGIILPPGTSFDLRMNVDGERVSLNRRTLVKVLEDPDENY